jgi:hypothetical protein
MSEINIGSKVYRINYQLKLSSRDFTPSNCSTPLHTLFGIYLIKKDPLIQNQLLSQV